MGAGALMFVVQDCDCFSAKVLILFSCLSKDFSLMLEVSLVDHSMKRVIDNNNLFLTGVLSNN